MASVEFIAEVGSNFGGQLATAKEYVNGAKQAGAQAVKFQTLERDSLVAPKIFADGAWVENPTYKNFSNVGLRHEWHQPLKDQADKLEIEFISTPFYIEAVEILESIAVRTYKIASGDITFLPLLREVGGTKKRVLLATGASSLADVEIAVATLTNAGAREIVLLHCVSNYPPAFEEMNLRAMVTMREAFGLSVGLSDHTPGHLIAASAVTLGASVIEKHFTFDRALPGPDHGFAMTVEEFGEMVSQIRQLENALGTGGKSPTPTELEKQHRIRRGAYDPTSFLPSDNETAIWLRPEHTTNDSEQGS